MELLVVISILSLLMSVLLPALAKARIQARKVIGMNNQKQIVAAVNIYAVENGGKYPDSVATVGFGPNWNWSDPRKLIGTRARTQSMHRAMSEYLKSYVKDASTFYCPNAPKKYKYLQQCWDAGDLWDNPETFFPQDPVTGTYCFWWSYTGCLGNGKIFRGPDSTCTSKEQSKILVSDYMGYDYYETPDYFGSCDKLSKSSAKQEGILIASWWQSKDAPTGAAFNAGAIDGSVRNISFQDTIVLKVSKTSDGSMPYDSSIGPGQFYIPK